MLVHIQRYSYNSNSKELIFIYYNIKIYIKSSFKKFFNNKHIKHIKTYFKIYLLIFIFSFQI